MSQYLTIKHIEQGTAGEVTLNLYRQTQLLTHTSTAFFLDYGTIYQEIL